MSTHKKTEHHEIENLSENGSQKKSQEQQTELVGMSRRGFLGKVKDLALAAGIGSLVIGNAQKAKGDEGALERGMKGTKEGKQAEKEHAEAKKNIGTARETYNGSGFIGGKAREVLSGALWEGVWDGSFAGGPVALRALAQNIIVGRSTRHGIHELQHRQRDIRDAGHPTPTPEEVDEMLTDLQHHLEHTATTWAKGLNFASDTIAGLNAIHSLSVRLMTVQIPNMDLGGMATNLAINIPVMKRIFSKNMDTYLTGHGEIVEHQVHGLVHGGNERLKTEARRVKDDIVRGTNEETTRRQEQERLAAEVRTTAEREAADARTAAERDETVTELGTRAEAAEARVAELQRNLQASETRHQERDAADRAAQTAAHDREIADLRRQITEAETRAQQIAQERDEAKRRETMRKFGVDPDAS